MPDLAHALQLIYLMLPVYCANMAPPFSKYWPGPNRPIDEERLGSHKTVVGFCFGVAAGIAVAFLQWRVDWQGSLVDYRDWLATGLACGLGAMLGDSGKSYIKRRIGIAPGSAWIPWDQWDFIVGGLIALSFRVRLSPADIVFILVFSFIADVVVNHLSFHVGIRETKW